MIDARHDEARAIAARMSIPKLVAYGARLANIAYAEPDAAWAALNDLGLEVHVVACARDGGVDVEYFIARDEREEITLLGIAGTNSIRDARIDAMALRKRVMVMDTPVRVHRGGHRCYRSLGGIFARHLRAFQHDEVIIAAHSLGGNIASQIRGLFCHEYRRVLPMAPPRINCVRFGSNRAGCPEFARYSDAQRGIDLRVEHENLSGETVDPVPKVPGSITKLWSAIERYRHAGHRVGLATEMTGIAAHRMSGYLASAIAAEQNFLE